MIHTLQEILCAAKASEPCTLAVAAAQDEDVLTAVCAAQREGIIRPLLVGDRAQIEAIAVQNALTIDPADILDEPDKTAACQTAARLAGEGKANLLMKGFVDTGVIMKAVLNHENNLRQSGTISHVAVMEVPGFDRLFYVTDSAMNVAPDLEQKAAILRNAVQTAHALGNEEPKAAVLCAVEKVNPKMPCTLDAQALTQRAQNGEFGRCLVQGPLALDNAVSPQAARHKKIDGPVAGYADILLVPDIEAGNMLNKAMEYFAHAGKASIMMGAKVPIVLTSRATSAESKMYSIALGVLIAAKRKEQP